jgi:hypothetical protein
VNPIEWREALLRVFPDERVADFIIRAAEEHKSGCAKHLKVPTEVFAYIGEQIARAFTPRAR